MKKIHIKHSIQNMPLKFEIFSIQHIIGGRPSWCESKFYAILKLGNPEIMVIDL